MIMKWKITVNLPVAADASVPSSFTSIWALWMMRAKYASVEIFDKSAVLGWKISRKPMLCMIPFNAKSERVVNRGRNTSTSSSSNSARDFAKSASTLWIPASCSNCITFRSVSPFLGSTKMMLKRFSTPYTISRTCAFIVGKLVYANGPIWYIMSTLPSGKPVSS